MEIFATSFGIKFCITCIYSSFAELLAPLFAVLSGSPAVEYSRSI
jgi:hypothetical protein